VLFANTGRYSGALSTLFVNTGHLSVNLASVVTVSDATRGERDGCERVPDDCTE